MIAEQSLWNISLWENAVLGRLMVTAHSGTRASWCYRVQDVKKRTLMKGRTGSGLTVRASEVIQLNVYQD
jgi:hypothetical protein